MSNLRIIFNNLADSANITASNSAAGFYASSMKTDRKGEVHRSTSRTVSYTLAWPSDVQVSAVALPATNLSSQATIRVRLYNSSGTMLADSGTVLACPGIRSIGWPSPNNANSFAYGGASKSAVWFDLTYSVRSVVIDLVDSMENTAGYIDCSRIVIGKHWEPKYNADYGAEVSFIDSSTSTRANSGDLVTSRSFVYDTLSFNISWLNEDDRAALAAYIKQVGNSKNIFVSLLPGSGSESEQDYMIYGKRESSPIAYSFYQTFANSFNIQGW